MWKVDTRGLPAAVHEPRYVAAVNPWLHDRIEVFGWTKEGREISMSLLGGFFCEFEGGPNPSLLSRYVGRIVGVGAYGVSDSRCEHYANHPMTRRAVLEDRKSRLENRFGYGAFADGLTRDELAAVDRQLAAL